MAFVVDRRRSQVDERGQRTDHLIRLDPNSEFAKNAIKAYISAASTSAAADPAAPARAPVTNEERIALRAKYAKREYDRKLAMFQRAMDTAVQREVENGRRFRTERVLSFSVVCNTYFGQTVKVLGGVAALGRWNPMHAIPLNWSEGNVWKGNIRVPKDDFPFEYKYITVDTNSRNVCWEGGFNRKIKWHPQNYVIDVVDAWGSGV